MTARSDRTERSQPLLPPGERFDRFTIFELINEGQRTRVYAAYDPSLDRRVALKLLRRELAHAGATEFLEAARAQAAISHPHVARVHAAGVFAGQPFVALEYAGRGLLSDWEKLEASSVRALIAKYAQVAGALAQAHASGLVHGDFNPERVLLRADGSCALTGFSTQACPSVPRMQRADVVAVRRALASALSSFERLEQGRVARALVRLDRYVDAPDATMEGLAQLLRAELTPRRQRVHLVILALAFVGLTAGALIWRDSGAQPPCVIGPRSIDEVWTPERRARVRELVITTGERSQEGADRLVAELDAWVADWKGARAEACRGAPPPAMRCLDGGRVQLSVLLELLLAAGAEASATRSSHLRVLGSMPRPRELCAEPLRAGSSEAHSLAPAQMETLLRLELAYNGQWEATADRQLLELERGLGPSAPLDFKARLLYLRALRARDAEGHPAALRHLTEAAGVALAAGDDLLAARILGRQAQFASETGLDDRSVSIATGMTDALLKRLPPTDPARLVLLAARVGVAAAAHRISEASALQREVLRITRRAQGEEAAETIIARANLAGMLAAADDTRAEAAQLFAEVEPLVRRHFGEGNALLIRVLANHADLHLRGGEPEKALPLLIEAEALAKTRHAAFVPDLLVSQALAHSSLGALELAEELAERALNDSRADVRQSAAFVLAEVAVLRQRPSTAVQRIQRALAKESDPTGRALLTAYLGSMRLQQGHATEARALLKQARALSREDGVLRGARARVQYRYARALPPSPQATALVEEALPTLEDLKLPERAEARAFLRSQAARASPVERELVQAPRDE